MSHAKFHCNRLTTVYKIFKITRVSFLGTQSTTDEFHVKLSRGHTHLYQMLQCIIYGCVHETCMTIITIQSNFKHKRSFRQYQGVPCSYVDGSNQFTQCYHLSLTYMISVSLIKTLGVTTNFHFVLLLEAFCPRGIISKRALCSDSCVSNDSCVSRCPAHVHDDDSDGCGGHHAHHMVTLVYHKIASLCHLSSSSSRLYNPFNINLYQSAAMTHYKLCHLQVKQRHITRC